MPVSKAFWLTIRKKPVVPALLVVSSAIIVSVIACLTAGRINNIYYSIHPFFGDTSSFFSVQFGLYFDALQRSKGSVIWQHFLDDQKNPLGYIPYLFLPKSFLLSMNSHLVFTGLAFAAFSALLGWAVFERSGSVLYGAIAPLLIFCAEGLFDPMYQLPSKLSDPPAAFIFGSALLCVLNSKQGRSLAWLAAFGLFAGLTLLSRFTSSSYLFFACAPILATYFVFRWRDPSYGWGHVIRASFIIAIPLIGVAGWHFVAHVRSVLYFYSVAGYSLHGGLIPAIQTTLTKFLFNFAGGLGLTAPILVCGTYRIMFRQPRTDFVDLATMTWAALAVPILVVGVLHVVDDAPQLAFGLAGYLLLALTPFPIADAPSEERKRVTQFAVVVGLALVPATFYAVQKRPYVTFLAGPSAQATSMVEANRKMAEFAANRQSELNRVQTMDADFDYYWRHLQPTAYYAFRTLLRTTRQFQIRKAEWSLHYRDKSAVETLKLLSADYDARTDILYLLSDPMSAQARDVIKDDYTATMAKAVLDWVRTAPNWTKLGEVETPWGRVEVWANSNRR